MSVSTSSLQRRLLAWLLLALLLSGLMLAEAYWSARKTVEKVYDKTLLMLALTISENVVANQGDLVSESILEILETVSIDEVYYRVSGPDSAYLTGYEYLPPTPENMDIVGGSPYYYNAEYEGRPVRMIVLKEYFAERDLSGWVLVQVAMTTVDRNEIVWDLMADATKRLLLLILVAFVVVWIAIKIGLKPLIDVRK